MPMIFNKLANFTIFIFAISFIIFNFMADGEIDNKIGSYCIAVIVYANNILDDCLCIDRNEVGCEMFLIIIEYNNMLFDVGVWLID